jgi:type VI secretion system protein VasI
MLRTLLTAPFLLLIPAAPAQADPIACSRIENDADRLRCFDRAFPRTVQPTGDSMASWSLKSSPSLLANRTDRSLTTESEQNIQCRWIKPRPVRLTIACTRNVTSISLETGCFMTSSQYRSYGDVTFSLDETEPGVASMAAGPDNRSLGLWTGDQAIPFVKSMLGKSRLTVRMTPLGDDPITAAFDIRGIDEAIAPLRAECGW